MNNIDRKVRQMPVEPFLKWAGGKRQLLPKLLPHFPQLHDGGKYFEPFLGGGAVFFALSPSMAILSDLNAELIEVYSAVRDQPAEIIEQLSAMPYDSDFYYGLRALIPDTRTQRAARFIYLNKTCFNGLYRVNGSGHFNVPFGRHLKSVEICNERQIYAASNALKDAVLNTLDFEESTQEASEGDLVYFDPPYTNAHNDNGFIEYNAKVFSWADQTRLARHASSLVERGVSVVISNGNHQAIRDCYGAFANFTVIEIPRHSTMAGSSKKRKPISELLLVGNHDHN